MIIHLTHNIYFSRHNQETLYIILYLKCSLFISGVMVEWETTSVSISESETSVSVCARVINPQLNISETGSLPVETQDLSALGK